MLAFLLANAFTSNNFSSLGPVVGGCCTQSARQFMHAHESTTGSSHKNVTGSCEGGEHTRIVRMQLMGCFTG